MKKAVLIVGVVGVVLSMGVVVVSVSLHLMNPRNISMDEAMLGIVPGSLCCVLSFFIAVAGLLMMLLMKSPDESERSSSRRKRRTRNEEDD